MRTGTYVAKCDGMHHDCDSWDEANDVAWSMYQTTGKLSFVEDYLGWCVITYEPGYYQHQHLTYYASTK